MSTLLCLKAGRDMPGAPSLDLSLVYTGIDVSGHATLSSPTEGSITFEVRGYVEKIVSGSNTTNLMHLEGGSLIQTGGRIVFAATLSADFGSGTANFTYYPENNDPQRFENEVVSRVSCPSA